MDATITMFVWVVKSAKYLQMNQDTIPPSKTVVAAWTGEIKLVDFLYFTTSYDSHMQQTCDLSYTDQVLGTVASGFYTYPEMTPDVL